MDDAKTKNYPTGRKANRLIWKLGLFISVFFIFGFYNFTNAATTGSSIVLHVDPAYDSLGRDRTTAILEEISQKAYFYAESDWWNNLSPSGQDAALNSISGLSREFDQNIYPQMTSVYGSEWNPGIDNDFRITILITKMSNEAGGYFNYLDEYPQSQFPSSNEREMLYLNATYLGTPRDKAFVAHEFQHLITFYQKDKLNNVDDDTWLNEARSEYAATLLGYDNQYSGSNLEKRVQTFLAQPSNSLTEWRNDISDYGVANLFMQYLVEHYGTKILTLMTQSSYVGINSIDLALNSLGANKTFADVFSDWALASFINACNLDSTQNYCYTNPNLLDGTLHVSPTAAYSLNQGYLELATWVKDWSPRWYEIDASGNQDKTLQISLEGFGATSNFRMPYITKENGQEKINFMSIGSDQKGSLLIPNFGQEVQAIILIPINTFKRSSFTDNDPNTPFSIKLSTQAGGKLS